MSSSDAESAPTVVVAVNSTSDQDDNINNNNNIPENVDNNTNNISAPTSAASAAAASSTGTSSGNNLNSSTTDLSVVGDLPKTPGSVGSGSNRGATAMSGASQGGDSLALTIAPGAKRTISVKTLYGASLHGKEETVTQLLQVRGKADLEITYKDGTTPLFAAANHGHDNIVKILLEAGANKEAKANNGATAICFAASKGHTAVVQELLDAGASQDVSISGWTPLHLSCSKGHHETTAALLKAGADPELPAANGHTPIALAIQGGHDKVLAALLDGGANPNTPVKGWMPLHIAVLSDQLACTKLLLESDADMNGAKEDGVTPVFVAAEKDLLEQLKALLDQDDIDMEAPSKNGATALWIACKKGNVRSVASLLENGADTKATASGWPCLHIAAEQNEAEIAKLFVDQVEKKENIVNINLLNIDGVTALMVAAQNCSIETAQALLECSEIKVDIPSVKQRASALCIAANVGCVEIVELLVAHGATVDYKASGDWTPAMMANENGFDQIVKFLVEKGAKLDESEVLGMNPLAAQAPGASSANNNNSNSNNSGSGSDNSCCCIQ